MKHLQLIVVLFAVAILSSCNSGAETTLNTGGGSAGIWTIPGIGTIYLFQDGDPNGSGQTQSTTLTVSSVGQHMNGKTNVVGLTETSSDSSGSQNNGIFYYAIEPNGDISLRDSSSSGIKWTTYPTGSRTTISDPRIDSITSFGEHIIQTSTRSYVASENVTTLAGTFAAIHITETSFSLFKDSIGSFADSSLNVSDFWFTPSIGFFAKVVESSISNGQPSFTAETDLIRYTPH